MTDQTFGKNRRSILLPITAGLVPMLVSTLSYFSTNPGLTSHTTTGMQAAVPSGRQMPTGAGMDEATQRGVMAPMQKLQKDPADLEALAGLTEYFVYTQDWQWTEMFALCTVVAASNEMRPLYMLGIIQHSQNRNAGVVASLKKVVAAKEDPSVRYSLGIPYAYYLEQPDKSLEQPQKALDNPDIPVDLKKAVVEEVTKIKEHKNHTPQQAQQRL